MSRPLMAGGAAALAATALSLGGCGHVPYASLSDRECLARVMYFESNRSSEDGMLAVGTVVMNRLQSGRYPKTVCSVVGQPQQFADGALSKPAGGRSYALALSVADRVLAGERHDGVGQAMFFHTAGYTFPYRNMAYVVAAGGNVFYEKRAPGTFTPVHPATLVAQAEAAPSRAVRARVEPTRYAEAEEPEERPRPVAARRPAPATEPDEDEPEERPRPVVRHRSEPLVIASLGSAPRRPAKAPPSIAELIEMDLKQQ